MNDSANPPNVELRGQREIDLSTRINSDIAWITGNLGATQQAHRTLAAKVERLERHHKACLQSHDRAIANLLDRLGAMEPEEQITANRAVAVTEDFVRTVIEGYERRIGAVPENIYRAVDDPIGVDAMRRAIEAALRAAENGEEASR
jgi:hypothetical protein